MKKVKLVVVTVVAMLFLGMSNASAQQKEPQTVIIRTFEFIIGNESKMIVTEPSGISQTIKLSALNLRKSEGISSNQATIQAEINKWKKDGFEIDAVTVGSIGDSPMTTIILSKKEQ